MFDQKKYDKEYYLKNKDKILARKKLYRTSEVHRQNSLARYHNDPEKFKLYQKQLRAENPKQHMVLRTRSAAKRRGLLHTISASDFDIPEYCPLLNIKLKVGVGQPTEASPSLDRINSSLGYMPGNVWVVSHRANKIKTDASLEELKTLTTNLERQYAHRSKD